MTFDDSAQACLAAITPRSGQTAEEYAAALFFAYMEHMSSAFNYRLLATDMMLSNLPEAERHGWIDEARTRMSGGV